MLDKLNAVKFWLSCFGAFAGAETFGRQGPSWTGSPTRCNLCDQALIQSQEQKVKICQHFQGFVFTFSLPLSHETRSHSCALSVTLSFRRNLDIFSWIQSKSTTPGPIKVIDTSKAEKMGIDLELAKSSDHLRLLNF